MKLKFKILLVSLSALMFSGLALIGMGTPVAAATATPANSVMSLTYEVQTDRQGNQSLVLLAKLTEDNGYPLSERSVAFFEKTDVFGDANVPIGSATTSAVGIASLKYETRVEGAHTFTVVYGGDDISASSVVTTVLDLENLPPLPPLSSGTGMEGIDHWALVAVGITVLIVWGLLVAVFIGTIKGIRGASKES